MSLNMAGEEKLNILLSLKVDLYLKKDILIVLILS